MCIAGCLLGIVLASAATDGTRLEAERLLKSGDAEQAAHLLERNLGTAPSAEQAELQVYLGLARFELMDFNGAQSAFRSALEQNPNLQLPDWANPRALTSFATERTLLLSSPPAATTQTESTPRPPQSALRQRVGLILAATGVATAATGLFFGARSRSSRTDAINEPSALRARQRFDSATTQAHLANVLFATGGGLSVLGLGLMAVPGPNGAWFSLSGTW